MMQGDWPATNSGFRPVKSESWKRLLAHCKWRVIFTQHVKTVHQPDVLCYRNTRIGQGNEAYFLWSLTNSEYFESNGLEQLLWVFGLAPDWSQGSAGIEIPAAG